MGQSMDGVLTAQLGNWRVGTKDYGSLGLRDTVFADGQLQAQDCLQIAGRLHTVRTIKFDGTFTTDDGICELWAHQEDVFELKLTSEPQKQNLLGRHRGGGPMPNQMVMVIEGMERGSNGFFWPRSTILTIPIRSLTLQHVSG